MFRFKNFDKEVGLLQQKLGPQYKGVISESGLVAVTALLDGQGTYRFDFKASKGNQVPQERLLADNDMFRVLGIEFFIQDRTIANKSIAVRQYYPNETVMVGGAGDTFVAAHLEAFYSCGYVTYKKGDTTHLPYLPLIGARFASQTQQSAAGNKSSTEHNIPGLIELKRPFNILGIDQGELTVNVPDAANLKLKYSNKAAAEVVIGIALHGILVSGGSKVAIEAGANLI